MTATHSLSANGKTIQLHDGRTLGYAEFGSPAAHVLFYFHGHPGSRLEARFLAEQAMNTGTRLIGIDRPGMGLSSFKAGRRIVDWPDDVVELANALRIDRFSVVGFSGGGPYALAPATYYQTVPTGPSTRREAADAGRAELGRAGQEKPPPARNQGTHGGFTRGSLAPGR